jgi:hypothetical protein
VLNEVYRVAFRKKVYRSIALYAELLGKETGQAAVEPAKLIPPMIARLMASDRAFAKAKCAKD